MSGMFGQPRDQGTHKSVEWYTPKWVFEDLGLQFDLDPASPHDHPSEVPGATKYTIFNDGLSKPWFGRVWLNPPYGRSTGYWTRRMIAHGNGIALVFSRTDAIWFQECMRNCSMMLFLSGRIEFVPGHENKHKRGRSGAGTALFAFGDECAAALAGLANHGVLMRSPVRSNPRKRG